MIVFREYLFEMDSNAFGRLRVRRLTIGAINELLKRLPDYKKRPGRDMTLNTASVLCIDSNGKTVDGTQLTDQELTTFSDQFLAAYPRITKVDDVPVNNISRQENENSIDYCGRVIADEISSYHDRLAAVIDKSGAISAFKELNKITDMFRENAKLSSFSKIMSASDSLRSAMMDVERFSASNLRKMAGIHDLERESRGIYEDMSKQQASIAYIKSMNNPIEIPKLPPNPIYETNEKIETLTEQVEVFTGTLTEHLAASAVALKGVAEQIEKGSHSTNRQNNIMITLTVISLFIAVIATCFGYLGYTMGKSAKEEKMQPSAVVVPPVEKSQTVPPKKTKRETKQPNSRPAAKQQN